MTCCEMFGISVRFVQVCHPCSWQHVILIWTKGCIQQHHQLQIKGEWRGEERRDVAAGREGKVTLQGDWTGCGTGNGEKISSSQDEPDQAINQLLLSFPPFPVRHPVRSPGMSINIINVGGRWPIAIVAFTSFNNKCTEIG